MSQSKVLWNKEVKIQLIIRYMCHSIVLMHVHVYECTLIYK